MRPAFDLHEYARDRDRASASKGDSAAPRSTSLASTVPARDMLALPESIFFERLGERVRRAELLLLLLRTGAVSRPTAARALRAQLEAIRRGAETLEAPQFVALLDLLAVAFGELAELPTSETEKHACEVLVLNENEISRDLVALAVESAGHAVRCAADFDEFVMLFGELRPDLVLSDAELSNAPPRFMCKTLRELVGQTPIVLFTSRTGDEIAEAARGAGVMHCVPQSDGVEALLAVLTPLFDALGS